MKFKTFYCHKPKLTAADAAGFSNKKYECRALLQDAHGKPVAILQRTRPNASVWKVQAGFSSVFFGTYAEALDYCRDRYYDLDGNKLYDPEV